MKKLITLATGLFLASVAILDSKPFQLSVIPDIAIHPRTERINGVTLGLWSENPQTALALGIVNGSTGQSAGFSWAYILNYANDYTGVQWAPINFTTGDFVGWQSGIVNYARQLTGLQLGVVNYAERGAGGVQIGLVNIMPSNAWFSRLPNELAPAMVFVNWGF